MKGATLLLVCMLTMLGLMAWGAHGLQCSAAESVFHSSIRILQPQMSESTEVSCPFEEIFELDLSSIAARVHGIAGICLESYLDMRPSEHLWAFLRIDYINVNTLLEKIDLQYYIQDELEAKWYIEIVEPNYIFTIPGQPVPWPGFVVGDLNVAFVKEYWNPAADVDHDSDVDIFDVVLAAAVYGSTSEDATWNPDCDIAEAYGVIDIYDLVIIAANYGKGDSQ